MSDITNEIKKRRTFAIISHPDAGKTTLTEKFLLYGGAINQAGSVKGKATAKHAVSDWMEIEKERGISVTSSVLQFNYGGFCINILDTPGHQDFSEDTYRTLMAADSAVMVIDASKGVEAQTRKLFKVCVMRHIPIFTFINKMDRDAMDTFELLDDIEKELGIATCPVTVSYTHLVLVMLFPQMFAAMFTADAALIEFTRTALRIYMACMLLFGIQMACQMTFMSIGNAKSSIIVAVMRKFILLLPLIYIVPQIWKSNQTMAVYLAEPIADFLAVSFKMCIRDRYYSY